ncbi:hypothetical protein Tco_1195468 [Tanacetum coccineum]
MGLWYSKDTGMFLIAYADADHAGCQDTKRSTSESAQFLGAGREWNCGTLLCSNRISTGWLLYQTLAKRKIQFLERKARYEKHVSENAKTSNRGRGRVKVVTQGYGEELVKVHRIMSSITAQQAKLDLELVPKEKRLEIGKCNGRLNPGKTQREPTFQVFLDSLVLTPCYSAYLTTTDVPKVYNAYPEDDLNALGCLTTDWFLSDGNTGFPKTDVLSNLVSILFPFNFLNLRSRDFNRIIQIFVMSLSGKTSGLDKLRLSRAQILWGMYFKKNVDYANSMHTSRDDYLINTLRFISANEESQIYGARLLESMTSPEMRETKAYKTYLGYATGVTPPKKAQKFKKPASPKLTTVLVSPEEPTRKSKRVKRPAKKSTNAPTSGVVIRDTLVMSLSKKKEKMTVEKRKGIELLSEVALMEEAQYEEVYKKSLRDFHRTHPSGSGIVTKIAPSAAKIKPSGRDEDDSNNDHDSSSEGSDQESDRGDDNTQSDNEKELDSKHETDENKMGSESDQEENEEKVEDDEEEKGDEFVKTPSNYTDDEDETNIESKVDDNAEGNEDKGMDYTTNQFDDDVDVRLNKPVNVDKGFIKKEGTDAEMINVQQGNENLEITLNQVIEDAHVIISTIAKKTKVPVTSSSHSFDLASKFLKILDIPHTDAEIIYPMDVHVHHEVPSNQTPTLLIVPVLVITESSPKEVVELKKDDLLNTQVTSLVDKHLDSRLGASREEFMSYLSASITVRITEQVKIQLPQILPKEVSRKDKDKDEDPFARSDRGLKKRRTRKDDKPTKEEPEFEVVDSDMPQDQEENLGNNDEDPKRKTPQQGPTQSWLMTFASTADKPLKTFDELMSTPIDFSTMVIQKRVKDLKLGVKSYQKKINVTKPKTTKPGIKNRDLYTPYQDPQRFIYVDNQGRNMLMRLDKLYKFSDGTLTRLRTSLDDITKNIRMEYLPQRR